MSQALARRYATAAFEAAAELKEVNALLGDARMAVSVEKKLPVILRVLSDERISIHDRINAITAVADELNFCHSMKGLLQVCVSNSRAKIIPMVLREVIAKICLAEGLAEVHASIADASFEAELKEKIESALSKQLGLNVLCKVAEEKDLIGGFILKVGSKTLDASVRGKLQKMKESLAKTSEDAK